MIAERSGKTRGYNRKREREDREDLIVSLSLGAPVHCPALSAGSEPDPLRRRPAAAKTESSSSQHPES